MYTLLDNCCNNDNIYIKMWFLLLLICVFLGVSGQLLLKKGVSEAGSYLNAFFSPKVIGGFTCYFLSALLYVYILRIANVSKVYPLVSMGYILVVLASSIGILVDKEPVSLIRWLGVIVICIGVFLISRS